jgi:hypothetical protein
MAAATVFRALVAGLLVTASQGFSEKSCHGEQSCEAVAEEEVAELATPLLQTGKTRQAKPSADAGDAAHEQTTVESAAGLLAVNASGRASAQGDHTCITKNCVCDDTVTCCYGTHCRLGWGGMLRCLFDTDPNITNDTAADDPEKCVCEPPTAADKGARAR